MSAAAFKAAGLYVCLRRLLKPLAFTCVCRGFYGRWFVRVSAEAFKAAADIGDTPQPMQCVKIFVYVWSGSAF